MIRLRHNFCYFFLYVYIGDNSIPTSKTIILLAACHSESDFSGEGTAEVSLCLLADPSFVKTKAIDVLAYQNVDNYTVELSKDGTIFETVKYGDMELAKKLEPGNYSIRAYYGENVAAGYDKLGSFCNGKRRCG